MEVFWRFNISHENRNACPHVSSRFALTHLEEIPY